VALDLEEACVASALAGRDSRYSGLIEQQRLFHNRQRP
jgi:hypothetical protein